MSQSFYRLAFKRTERVKDPKGLGGGGRLGRASEAGGGVEAPGHVPPPVARPPALPVSKRNRPSAQGPQRRHCGPRRSGARGQPVSIGGTADTGCAEVACAGCQGTACDLSPQRRGATRGWAVSAEDPNPHRCAYLHRRARTYTGTPAPVQECMYPHRSACSCAGVHGPTQVCRHRCAYPHRCDCVSVAALRSGRVWAVSALTMLHKVCSRQSTATAT